MTEHYVTLFDSVFLPQGLALHHSLLEHGGDCVLWVLCLDDACLKTLQRLDLPKMRLLSLAMLETPELVAVKPGRTRAEYCWTLTPWSIQWVLEADLTIKRVTYLDADTFFMKSPHEIYEEFEKSGRSVLITDHGYAPQYDQTEIAGRYCVQFMIITRGDGEALLNWWRDKCIEWCYARYEDGLFGDQKYLEQFEPMFPGTVYTTGHDKRFQAPWNSVIFDCSDAVLFHFHALRISSRHIIRIGHGTNYELNPMAISLVYKPYCQILFSIIPISSLPFSEQVSPPIASHLLTKMLQKIKLKLKRRPRGTPSFIISCPAIKQTISL